LSYHIINVISVVATRTVRRLLELLISLIRAPHLCPVWLFLCFLCLLLCFLISLAFSVPLSGCERFMRLPCRCAGGETCIPPINIAHLMAFCNLQPTSPPIKLITTAVPVDPVISIETELLQY
jgi:hypothetical protein